MGSGQMMPELGSRISLISKADIRYEGRLFTVDPQECTIALANVRSFGTEDRETAYPIMPQPTVYDYILFRGADIKDIRVVNNVPIPNDPAIMQMHLPPQQQPGFPPQQQMPTIQSGPMQFGPFSNLQQGPPVPSSSTSLGGGQNIPQQQPSQQLLSPQQSSSQQDSRSGTPNQSRKSPTSDMGVQTFENQRASGGDQNKEKMMQRNNQYQRNNNNNQRERRDSGRNDGGQENRGGGNYRQNFQHNRMQQQQPQHNQHNKNTQQQQNRGPPNRGYQGGSGRMRPPQNQHQNFPQNFRGGHNQNVNNRQMSKPNGGPQKNQKTLKFENEFDFEKANSKFEELRSELSKLKVGEESKPTEQVNGEVEKKDDSGNETGADQTEQEVDDVQGYDKTKSFFDNISCEANERSKGKTQRTDWRQERKINTETFGLTMNRRGNFRGRGYYHQYGNRNQYGRMNNYRSGGNGGMPMQYNNNRNRTQNGSGRSNNNNNNQGQQQQSQNKPASTAAAGDK